MQTSGVRFQAESYFCHSPRPDWVKLKQTKIIFLEIHSKIVTSISRLTWQLARTKDSSAYRQTWQLAKLAEKTCQRVVANPSK